MDKKQLLEYIFKKHLLLPDTMVIKIVAWIKNNRILIIFWLMGIAICATLIFYPKRYYIGWQGSQIFQDKPSHSDMSLPVMQWSYVVPICLSILIIGGLLIYTLRDKRK